MAVYSTLIDTRSSPRLYASSCNAFFGMKVLYSDVIEMPAEAEARAGATRVGFDELLAASDFVTLHVPLDASTRRMIDGPALAKMLDSRRVRRDPALR